MKIIRNVNHSHPGRPAKVHAVIREEPESLHYADRRKAYVGYCNIAYSDEAIDGTIDDVTCVTCLWALKRMNDRKDTGDELEAARMEKQRGARTRAG